MTLAFVFPGQGSQSVGMLNSISDRPEVRATLQEASDALGEDVAKLIAEGPAEALSLTTNTQPVMLTAGVAFASMFFLIKLFETPAALVEITCSGDIF